jgi:hypothetical protein
VVIESDDWGLCAWVPDEDAYQALAGTPAWRSPPGLRYGRSTLESAADVHHLTETLLGVRGGDGFPPVWQANTVMAAPDYDRVDGPDYGDDPLPIVALPGTPSRWARPGMWDAVAAAIADGLWWPELHGLCHLPVAAWRAALREGDEDARLAHAHQTTVCARVEASGEFAATEPDAPRRRTLERAIECFETAFGRRPQSWCPPDYLWDDFLEREAEQRGIGIIQGKAEQKGKESRVGRWFGRPPGMETKDARFYLPARIAFEPCGDARAESRLGPASVHEKARAAWRRGQPAVVSTHRLNYAHLDEEWSRQGRAALAELLRRLTADQAIFLTDAEVRALVERGWSARPIGERGLLLRVYGETPARVRIEVPEGVSGASLREGKRAASPVVSGGVLAAELGRGEFLFEWIRA